MIDFNEVDFSIAFNFADGGEPDDRAIVGIKTKNKDSGRDTAIYMFAARKRHSKFFRELADKLDSLKD